MAFDNFRGGGGYSGLGQGLGFLLGALLVKRPLEQRQTQEKEKDEIKQANDTIQFYVDAADKLGMSLDDYIGQVPYSALEPLYKAQKVAGRYVADIAQTQMPQIQEGGMPYPRGLAPLSSYAGPVSPPAAQTPSTTLQRGYIPRSVGGVAVSPTPRPKGVSKAEFRRSLQTAPEQPQQVAYQYRGAPVAPPEELKNRIPLTAIWTPDQIKGIAQNLKYLKEPDVYNYASTFSMDKEAQAYTVILGVDKTLYDQQEDARKAGKERKPPDEKAYDLIREVRNTAASGIGRAGENIIMAKLDPKEREDYAKLMQAQIGILKGRPSILAAQGYDHKEIDYMYELMDASVPTPENTGAAARHDKEVMDSLKKDFKAIVTDIVGSKPDKDEKGNLLWSEKDKRRMDKAAKDRGYDGYVDFAAQYQEMFGKK